MDSRETSAALGDVVQMLERAEARAREALTRREAKGEPISDRTPPAVALRVLEDLKTKIQDGSVPASAQRLGLSRGAGDLEWHPDEEPLIALFYEIDDYWQEHIWDGSEPDG